MGFGGLAVIFSSFGRVLVFRFFVSLNKSTYSIELEFLISIF